MPIPSQAEVLAWGEQFRQVVSDNRILRERLELIQLQFANRSSIIERMDTQPLNGFEIPEKVLALANELWDAYVEIARAHNVTPEDVMFAVAKKVIASRQPEQPK